MGAAYRCRMSDLSLDQQNFIRTESPTSDLSDVLRVALTDIFNESK